MREYNYDGIRLFCKTYLQLDEFSIDTLEVSTDGDVNFDKEMFDFLTHIPFKFRRIDGNLALNPNFTSWENCPDEIGCNLYFTQAKIPSLVGMPTVNGVFSISKSEISSLEGFRGCRKLRANNSKLVDLSSAPKENIGGIEIGGDSLRSLRGITNFSGFSQFCIGVSSPNLSPYEMRYLLLCKFNEFLFDEELPRLNNVLDILMDGRVNGVMPSELIPGKIAELKAMR